MQKMCPTSTVLRASLIMNSSPPNTACVELQASMSESLSSESLRETTTDLCLGSCRKHATTNRWESVKLLEGEIVWFLRHYHTLSYMATRPCLVVSSSWGIKLLGHSRHQRWCVTGTWCSPPWSLLNGAACQGLTISGALGAWCPLVNLLVRGWDTVLRLTVLRFPLVGCWAPTGGWRLGDGGLLELFSWNHNRKVKYTIVKGMTTEADTWKKQLRQMCIMNSAH